MLCFPNCKINIGLYVTGRRPDGYHDIETIFYPIILKDALEIVPADKAAEIFLSGKAIHGDNKDNLVWKAYELMREHFPSQVNPLNTYLHKAIPMGAGLGGGSADGACMLRLINDFFYLHLSDEQLISLALQLGSDCPFFIYNTPQFARGRGEIMESVSLNLSHYSIQLICPEVHISTAKAFEMLTSKPASFDLKNISSLAVETWKENISNDFEKPVFQMYPQLKDIKEQLYNQGALYASMSGSGSAIYGIFPKGQHATIRSELKYESYVV